MTKRLALLTLLLATATLLKAATTWNVTPTGGGTRDGTNAANAWALSDFNGNSKPTAGDTVLFTGSFAGTASPASNGNSTSPLTLDFRQATFSSGFSLTGRSYLTVLGGATSPSYAGDVFTLTNCSNVHVDGWTFLGSNGMGDNSFMVLNGCSHITLSNCKAVNCGFGFIGDMNHFITITGCDVTTSADNTDQVDNVHFGSATDVVIEKSKLILRAPGYFTVRHNDVIQTYQSGAAGGFPSTNWVIRYNWIENANVQPASDGNSSWTMLEALVGTPAIKIYDNVFTCPTLTGSGGVNNGVRDNKNPNAGDTHYLYNNTLIKRANPGNVMIFLAPGTAIWKNNILWSPAGQASGNPNATMSVTADYNFIYRNGSSFAGSHGSTSLDPLLKDPGNNDFSLQPNSPCIGKADNTIGAEFAFGIAPGSTWPNPTVVARTGAWDVGAFVSNAGPAPSPTVSPAPSATSTPAPTATPSPTPANKFKTGDYVTPSATVNIRTPAAGVLVGTHIVGEIGQIIGGPVLANLNGAPVNWYEVGWTDNPTDGWVGDNNLTLTAAPVPAASPSPSGTPCP